MKLISIKTSQKPEKKLVAIIEKNGRQKKINFGSKGSKTYISGASIKVKDAYIKRHEVRENWNNINPGSLSRYILWGKSKDINKNIKFYKNKFNL